MTAAQQPHLQEELTKESIPFTLAREDDGDSTGDRAAEVLVRGERSLSLNSLRGGGEESVFGMLLWGEIGIEIKSGWGQTQQCRF